DRGDIARSRARSSTCKSVLTRCTTTDAALAWWWGHRYHRTQARRRCCEAERRASPRDYREHKRLLRDYARRTGHHLERRRGTNHRLPDRSDIGKVRIHLLSTR